MARIGSRAWLPCDILCRSDSHTSSDIILSCSQLPVIRDSGFLPCLDAGYTPWPRMKKIRRFGREHIRNALCAFPNMRSLLFSPTLRGPHLCPYASWLFMTLNISRTLCVISVGLFSSSTPEGNWNIVSRPLNFRRSRLVCAVHIPRRNNILVFFVWDAV